MKIVIVGNGKIGFSLSQQLSKEGHDVVIIDNKSVALAIPWMRRMYSVSRATG